MDPPTGFILMRRGSRKANKSTSSPADWKPFQHMVFRWSLGVVNSPIFKLQLQSQNHWGHLHFFALVGQVSRAKLCQRFRTKCPANHLSLNPPFGAGRCNCGRLRSSVPGRRTLRFSSAKASAFVFVFCLALLWNKDNVQPIVCHPDKARGVWM